MVIMPFAYENDRSKYRRGDTPQQLTLFPFICGCGGEIDYHHTYKKGQGISQWATCLKCMKAEFLNKGESI